jgi:hypothetical protein
VSAIDVVHKDFFDDWVKRHVEVYAKVRDSGFATSNGNSHGKRIRRRHGRQFLDG